MAKLTTANCLKFLVLAQISAIIILSATPPVSRDALTHHLAVPKRYVEAGGIFEIPWMIPSYYPMNVDLLYWGALNLGSDIAPKYIHFTFCLLTAFLIHGYLKDRLNPSYAWLGVFLFLSLPIITKLSITAYVDHGLIFFSTLSLLFLLKWRKDGLRLKWLILSGFCCGIGLGTKYNGLVPFAILALLTPLIYIQTIGHKEIFQLRKSIQALGCCLLFGMISLIVFSPWCIRNYRWTGNPVYPLFNSAFQLTEARSEDPKANGTIRSITLDKSIRKVSFFELRRVSYNESILDIALIPVRIFFQGEDGNPKLFDGKMSPILIIFPLLGLLIKRIRKHPRDFEYSLLLVYSILLILFVFFRRDMRIRYIAPAIPPLVILSIMGIHGTLQWAEDKLAGKRAKYRIKVLIGLSLSILFWPNVAYLSDQFQFVRPIEYLRGNIGRDQYISIFWKEYPILQHANKALPENAVLLSFFIGGRSYYSDREMRFYEEWFSDKVLKSESIEELCCTLSRHGLTHILLRKDLFARWLGDNFNDKQKEFIEAFFQTYTVFIMDNSAYSLFEIKE